MARVPTWTELRMDATKLAQLQLECYQSVHDMLDKTIPEIDRKLALLNLEIPRRHRLAKSNTTSFIPELEEQFKALNTNEWDGLAPNMARTSSPVRQRTITKDSSKKRNGEPSQSIFRQTTLRKNIAQTNGRTKTVEIVSPRTEPNLHELEHLKPLPMPISHYLKMNRPDVVKAADRRVMYLKKKAEKRKQIASSRTINALDMIRSSSRASSNRGTSSLRSSLRSSARTVYRDNFAPNYQVRYRLSELEMKRLTARVYNRLPEVKLQKKEEVTKHMKVQNYKNKMEYGRKLLMNRRQGVINYPLRSNQDDSSNISSQEESFTNSLE